jgi:hypothetical protein
MSAAAKPSPAPRGVGREVYKALSTRPPASELVCSAWNLVLPAPSLITPMVEECFVLEGEVNIERHEYRPGDYVVAQAGTDTIVSAPGGPLLLHWNATSFTGAGLVA